MKSKNNNNDDPKKLSAMKERFSTSTDMERLRFLRACKGKLDAANKKLQSYMDWRELHGLNSPEYQALKLGSTTDQQDWKESCELALKHAEKAGLMVDYSNEKGTATELPQIVFVYTDEHGVIKKCLDGSLILHAMPASLDVKKAPCAVYTLALGLYLDRKQNRETLDRFGVMLDVRGIKGAANARAYDIMPFIKSATALLEQHYPERLNILMVYPLPTAALLIWKMVKPFLDVSVVSKAHLIPGKDTSGSPPPNDALRKFVDRNTLEEMEKHRVSMFKEVAPAPAPAKSKGWFF